MLQLKIVLLDDTIDPVNYSQLSQTITHTYVITNGLGNVPLGPTQFTISDDHMGTFNCGPAAFVLQRHETVTCTASYTITQADLDTEAVKFTATAAGGGATSAVPAILILKNNNLQNNPPPPAADLAPGTTIQYTVAAGDWLMQIARCYGADYQEVRKANPRIANPAIIAPALIVTVPHIGNAGPIYGPPCVGYHTVQAGDTWNSIAQKYNADLLVLQEVNPGALYVGRVLKVPLNSA
jgi:LysM repeat protein